MKKTNQFGLLTAILFATAALFNNVSAQTNANTKSTTSGDDLLVSARSVAKKWQEAYNREDAATLGGMYTAQVVRVQLDGTTKITTPSEIKYSLENDFIVHDEKIEINVGNAIEMPDGKLRITGTYSTSETDAKTGETIKTSGLFDNILTKDAGVWKLSQTETIPNK